MSQENLLKSTRETIGPDTKGGVVTASSPSRPARYAEWIWRAALREKCDDRQAERQ